MQSEQALDLQHCKLYNPQITPDGYFKGIIVDYYDFDWSEYLKNIDYGTYKAYIANDYFVLIQLLKGHNYYILAPILFKW